MKAKLLIGLPGSGKSFLGKLISEETGAVLIDDPVSLDPIKALALEGKDLVIVDPHLCNASVRVKAIDTLKQYGYTDIDVQFFENDAEKCLRNIEYRNDGRIISRSGLESFHYTIPLGVPTIKIWQKL